MADSSIRRSRPALKKLYFQSVTRLSLSWYSGVTTVSASDDDIFGRVRMRGRGD